MRRLIASTVLTAALATPALAQDAPPGHRYRVAIGPQAKPRYPGTDTVQLLPLISLSRARGDEPFTFSAPDQGFSIPLFDLHGFSAGPALNIQASRRASDVGIAVPKVGTTVEAGGFVQYRVAPGFRLRGELRKGIGGHKGLIGEIGADYVARDGDRWLFSIGPRVTLIDDRFAGAYFGITPATATATGLPRFTARGGLEAVGATTSVIRQLSPHWGLYGFGKYDRLVDDAGRSPLTQRYGARNQFSGGLALTYTFTRR
ncbi:MipA/OmpV family protein [Sphingomonas sp.]|uniref:MipA/OmpV family protein n=1 Tax=Sphingomonas sp. TaxID=28214 RepID=UPI003CC615AF